MWNYAALCGGRARLNIFVRIWYDMWMSHERESVIIFSGLLMCC